MSDHTMRRRRDSLLRRQGPQCWWCSIPLVIPVGRIDLFRDTPPTGCRWATVDHLVARSEGGSSRLENLRLACHLCNAERAKMQDPVQRAKVEGNSTDTYVPADAGDAAAA